MSVNPASSWYGFTLLSMFIPRALALLECTRVIQPPVLRWAREACVWLLLESCSSHRDSLAKRVKWKCIPAGGVFV